MGVCADYYDWWSDEPEDWGFGDWEESESVAREWAAKAVIPERVKRPHPSRLLQLLGILIALIGFPGVAPGSAIAAFYAMGERRWQAQGFWPAGMLAVLGLVLAAALATTGLMLFEYGRKRRR